MQNDKVQKYERNFGADEVIKPMNNSVDSKQEEVTEDLKPIKYYKTYELNEEGLRLYGMYKKQQHLNIIKWSLLGTCIGCSFAAIIDISFRKIKFKTKDYLKAFFLVGSIVIFSFYGIQGASMKFRIQQRELSQKYGKEVEEKES